MGSSTTTDYWRRLFGLLALSSSSVSQPQSLVRRRREDDNNVDNTRDMKAVTPHRGQRDTYVVAWCNDLRLQLCSSQTE